MSLIVNLFQILIDYSWQLRSLSGNVLSENLLFKKDGSIGNSAHPNESYWKFNSGKLIIYSSDNAPTSEFSDFYHLGDQYYQLIGNFLLDTNEKFILESQAELGKIFSKLGFEANIGKGVKKLIIQFNSAGTPFNQNDLQREFNTLINSVGQDIVRVSQSSPPFWYINFTQPLTKILGGFISNYEQIFILGSSAGGYAALLLGEILSSLHSDKQFMTFSINAKTSFDEKHMLFLEKSYDKQYFSLDIMDSNRLAYADCATTDISQYLKVKKTNVSHQVFYDIKNPVEKYHYNLISDFTRVHLHAFELGFNHGDGCVYIGNSEYFRKYFISSINEVFSDDSLS